MLNIINFIKRWITNLSDLETKSDIYNNPDDWVVIDGKWLARRG